MPHDARAADRPAEAAGGDGSRRAPLWSRVPRSFMADQMPAQAAHVAFFAFLSFPPAVLVLFALTGLFGGERVAEWVTNRLEAALPTEASALVDGFVDQVVLQQAPGVLSLGLLIAVWAASNVFAALGSSLETAYKVPATARRSWIEQRAVALGVMVVFALLFLTGSALLIAGPGAARALGIDWAERLWVFLQWPLAMGLVVTACWISYYILPGRDQTREKKPLLIGAVTAALLWVLATAGFRVYIANFGNYTETYGVLGGIIVFQLWLWISALVILLGGELASEMKQSRG